MGVILSGILGGFSGKVGPVVGGKWKDVDYMRSYVIPANPNTDAQQAVRAKFAQLVSTARLILSTILQAFWDPFYSNMSGFNAWIKQNYSLADTDGLIDETAIMSKGTLETLGALTATYATGTGLTTATFSSDIFGNGDANDKIGVIAYDTVNKNFYFEIGDEIRDTGEANLTIATGLTATNVLVWVFAYRGTGAELIVSDSSGAACSAV